jgi:hypothetical protein
MKSQSVLYVGDKSFSAVLYKAKQDALFGEHVRP